MLTSALVILASMAIGAIATAIMVYVKVIRPLTFEMSCISRHSDEIAKENRKIKAWIKLEAGERVAAKIEQRLTDTA